jgi:hypothetical protein
VISSISSSLEPSSTEVVISSSNGPNELLWREFLESSLTLRFCCLVDLNGRLLPELILEVRAEGEAGVRVPVFSYSVIRAPLRRLVPCSCKEGVGEGIGEVIVPSGAVSLAGGLRVRLAVAAAKVACLPACLIRLISAFVGRIMRPSFVLGRAGQLSWLAL